MKKAKTSILIAATTCLAIGALSWLLLEQYKPKYSWNDLEAFEGQATWSNMQPVFEHMPPLPPNIKGVALSDGTRIPRSYFDKPPIVRRFFPPEHVPPEE